MEKTMILNKLEIQDSLHFIKYMGSKSKIIPFLIEGIQEVYNGGVVCDLFSGSCTLSGAIGSQVPMISNDIQAYSSVLAKTYLTDWNDNSVSSFELIANAQQYYKQHYEDLLTEYVYPENCDLKTYNRIEKRNRSFINKSFSNDWHLFTKNYSGTWWSAEQCAWIDSLRKAIEDYKGNPAYNTMLSSLMFAMAYCSQGTGHYAQYRDAKTESSMKDIQIYRRKSIVTYFKKKMDAAIEQLPTIPCTLDHKIVSGDYKDCLRKMNGGTVYADPPYCFVHYSRFYHAIETLVLYDYPEIQYKNGQMVKGRYREERHQSPFSIRSQVSSAFKEMFDIIAKNGSSLVLSYSDTGMITEIELLEIANKAFKNHIISIRDIDHQHMTMGRLNDRNRNVKELLLIVKPI